MSTKMGTLHDLERFSEVCSVNMDSRFRGNPRAPQMQLHPMVNWHILLRLPTVKNKEKWICRWKLNDSIWQF